MFCRNINHQLELEKKNCWLYFRVTKSGIHFVCFATTSSSNKLQAFGRVAEFREFFSIWPDPDSTSPFWHIEFY